MSAEKLVEIVLVYSRNAQVTVLRETDDIEGGEALPTSTIRNAVCV